MNMIDNSDLEADEKRYVELLGRAHVDAQRALDMLYEPGGIKRSLWHRMLLGRAQSILIGLYVQEVGRRRNDS